jgi:ADP-ribosyl-[dinitrogen reductase] hydrolase
METIAPRTSHSHPLQIAEIRPAPSMGLIGLTLCPGKTQSWGLSGPWARDLRTDLDAVAAWNAAVVVTLVEADELERLQVPKLGREVVDRHMEWVHLPIPDRGVPDVEFEAAWITVGESLRNRLRAGINILVHCMGGLGRAGTIAARLLVELGWQPDDAIRAVRKVRPGALETDAQEDLVHGLIALPEALPDTGMAAVRERAIGSLLGLAVGDALGTTLEFSRRDSRPRLTGMEGGGPFRLEPGQWTDDTSMAMALADSLITCDGLDELDLMTRFVSWMDDGAYSSNGRCFDIGGTVRAALTRFKMSGDPIAGSTDPQSAGNGSLMRLAPVAIRYWDNETSRRDAAARQSRTTHGAPERWTLASPSLTCLPMRSPANHRVRCCAIASATHPTPARSPPSWLAAGAASRAAPSAHRAMSLTVSRRQSGAWRGPARLRKPCCMRPTLVTTPTPLLPSPASWRARFMATAPSPTAGWAPSPARA